MQLSDWDRACLSGDQGGAAALAMKILVQMGTIAGASRMIDVVSAHIDGGLYHGRAGLDFAERLASSGGKVRVPTTMNVSSLDLLHPDLYRGDVAIAAAARKLMEQYVAMGCRQTWTCAPYQLPDPPAFGEHIAWAESNAIVFANSVLGARTDRYGDFMDISAAITGRVPEAGLHLTEQRAATIVYEVEALPVRIKTSDLFLPVLGHLIGRATRHLIPAIVGLPDTTTEDELKAFGAAAASSGSVALFHAVGITPEAPTLDHALQGRAPRARHVVTEDEMHAALDELSSVSADSIDAISVGTPHMSVAELTRLADLFEDRPVAEAIAFYASTGRDVLKEIQDAGIAGRLENSGVRFVTDTCTYITPILDPDTRVVMTDSAKWAYYAPGNLGVDVVFASLSTCVESAVAGKRVEGDDPWD
jgi:predicted aconitase